MVALRIIRINDIDHLDEDFIIDKASEHSPLVWEYKMFYPWSIVSV